MSKSVLETPDGVLHLLNMLTEKQLQDRLHALGEVECVVRDHHQFKLKVGLGEEAYASLRITRHLQELWDVGGAAAAGAGVAKTLLAASGPLAVFGLAASTPVGWLFGAALLSGSTYYGVMRMIKVAHRNRVDVIPKFISSPIDLLGATLFDQMGGLAIKVGSLTGAMSPGKKAFLIERVYRQWGINPDYARLALPLIQQSVSNLRLKAMTQELVRFQIDNPDCNPQAMRADLYDFVQAVAQAEGEIGELEELALEAIDSVMDRELSARVRLGRSAEGMANTVGTVATGTVRSSLDRLSNRARRTLGFKNPQKP